MIEEYFTPKKNKKMLQRDKHQLTIQSHFAELKEKYDLSKSKYSNILALGDYGTGKSSLYATCPKPCVIFSFDPSGTSTEVLQEFIDNGDIIVLKFEDDDWQNPHAFRDWQKEFLLWKRNGWFDNIATVGIDSITNWAPSLLYHIMATGMGKGVGPHAGAAPFQSDYMWQQLHAGNILRKDIMPLPCHILITGHPHYWKDDITGKTMFGLLMWGKIADQVPLLFDEKYVTRITGGKHVLQTKNDGVIHAETRMGGKKFDKFMEPDIRALLKKAGKSWEDKPRIADLKEEMENE